MKQKFKKNIDTSIKKKIKTLFFVCNMKTKYLGSMTTWVYDIKKNSWEQGPNLIQRRHAQSCFFDSITNQLYVFGGYGGGLFVSMEKWKIGTNTFEVSSSLPEPISYSAATLSNSNNFVGYLVGGVTNGGYTNKVWGLRRRDETWVEMKSLQKQRGYHSLVNLPVSDIPGC